MTKEIGYLLLTGILWTVHVIHFMGLVLHFIGGIWKLNCFRLLFCLCISSLSNTTLEHFTACLIFPELKSQILQIFMVL